ncbi:MULTISPECIES: STAS domain-containing protein [Cellulomonas]|uniref:STAS domain-containing protein n=1 Tax=Cellulomonas gelida TaxID=1712 RepID=A0A4Y3KLU5_9CELL|nr:MULTISPECIES: STAS domain-containing protein [Cellulomonas]MCR6704584.1 STAS domain-containing protein [Cellulomonas sp.]GEA84354.1 hypothetical protein CGE01nite_16050 [Cellulomonas gelida]GGL33075.1 hypothetical protein GCM10009774_24450 [Cellulomonas gelida]
MRDGNSTIEGGPVQPTAGPAQDPSHRDGEQGGVHVIVGADATRIVLSGEVDADLGAELHEATTEAENVGLPIEVDAHHVTFMDSSGVAFLARLSIRSQHRVRLLRVPPTVRFLLEVTRIGELLDVVEESDEREFQPVAPDARPH